jgi:hypothetical protein
MTEPQPENTNLAVNLTGQDDLGEAVEFLTSPRPMTANEAFAFLIRRAWLHPGTTTVLVCPDPGGRNTLYLRGRTEQLGECNLCVWDIPGAQGQLVRLRG